MFKLHTQLTNHAWKTAHSSNIVKFAKTMATASTVQLGPAVEPQYHRTGGDSVASSKASQLLQQNHDKYHIFFNSSGFHNHLAHHILSLWAMKATPSELQSAFDNNSSYQRPYSQPSTQIISDLHDPEKFIHHLGPREHYNDFLSFFTSEIESKGWQSVLQEYVFSREDPRAEQLFIRMHGGLLHPLIHLGFGVEFEQPAIIAEALAQAACHENWIGELMLPAEKLAAEQQGQGNASKTIVQLLDEVAADPELRRSPHWEDANKIRDGILARAGDKMIGYAAQIRVAPTTEDLEKKTAEMTNAVAYYTAGAQRREKMVKYDFYFIHHLNASIFYPAFARQTWLAAADKARLLEWKIRLDLVTYVSRNSPQILIDEIRGYRPAKPSGLDEVEQRVRALSSDDGHAVKLVRALANGMEICKPFEADREAFRLRGDDWVNMAHMAIDSVEGPGDTWVRSAGWDEAWEGIPAKL